MLKRLLLIVVVLFVLTGTAHSEWDFYFFGVNAKTFKEADYKMVILGAATSLAVHTAGHYLYAEMAGMDIRQDGFTERLESWKYSNKHNREFAQAGFVLQHAVGVLLTSIPYTRQTDFTRGYVAFAFAETATYPLVHQGVKGDLNYSNKYGGDRDLEYAAFMAVATHNMLRVKWYKEEIEK